MNSKLSHQSFGRAMRTALSRVCFQKYPERIISFMSASLYSAFRLCLFYPCPHPQSIIHKLRQINLFICFSYTEMREEFQTSVLSSCCCFLAGYLAVAGLNLLAQFSDKIHHFTALNSVHFRKLG